MKTAYFPEELGIDKRISQQKQTLDLSKKIQAAEINGEDKVKTRNWIEEPDVISESTWAEMPVINFAAWLWGRDLWEMPDASL